MQLPETPGMMPFQPQTGCGFGGWRGRGRGGGRRLAAGGPVVFPVASKKETKWEVECAGCQQAGRPQRAPPPSLEAHSRPEPSLLAAAGPSRPAPASRAGTVSTRLWLRLGRSGRAPGPGASGTSGTGSRASPGAHERCALAGCASRVWREPGKGRPPGWPPGPGRARLLCAATARPAGPDGEFTGAAAAVGLRSQRRGVEPGACALPRALASRSRGRSGRAPTRGAARRTVP